MRFFISLLLYLNLFSANSEFSLYQKESGKGHTLLVIGGIHGNEPGGYFAASFLERYYTVSQGNLWIVPNLNVDSIIENNRGIYGDMNRKFNIIKERDEDFKSVNKIKEIILDKKVDLVLNLHDGYGFYRHDYENAIFNPNAWGQTTIIDQTKIDGLEKFGNLDEIAQSVNTHLNREHLVQDYHSFGVKNTQTKFKDEQMQLSLTFFAVTHHKPAFAIETSKNITDLTQKVIYQLKSIEEFMKIMGIKYTRNFNIDNYQDVQEKLFAFGSVKINNNISLTLNELRPVIRYIPLKKEGNEFKFTHNLGAVKQFRDEYVLYIGNRPICEIKPQIFELGFSLKSVQIEVDGAIKEFDFGDEVSVNHNFKVINPDGYRVNIIGYSKRGYSSEDGLIITKKEIANYYSLDKDANVYRVEFYKDGKFYGMINVRFVDAPLMR